MTLVDYLKNIKTNLEKKKDSDALFFFETYLYSVDLIKKMREMSDLPDGFHVRNISDNKEYWCKIYEMIIIIALNHAHENASEANKDVYEILDRISLAFWEELINSLLIKSDLLKIVETLEEMAERGLVKKENWTYIPTEKGRKIMNEIKFSNQTSKE